MESRRSKLHLLRGVKNASYLALGNLASQAISLVGFTYIARMLGPDGYGTYVTVGVFVGMFDVLLLEGLNKALVREGSHDVSSMHLALERTVGIRNLLSLVAVVVCMAGSLFAPYSVQTRLYIMLFSFELAFTALNGFLGTIYQATERMQYIAILGIAKSALCVSLSIVFLYCGFGLPALFLTVLGSEVVAMLATYRYSQSLVPFKLLSLPQCDWHLLKPALVFSLLTFMAFFVSRVDLVMVSFLGNAQDVGVYAVAYKIGLQGEMLRNVCAVAFFPVFVKRFQREALRSVLLVKYAAFFLVGVFALAAAASFFVEGLVTFLFGSQYEASGGILRVLVFYLAFSWASLPFTTSLQATHNERYIIIPVLTAGGLNVILNYLLFQWFGLIGIAYSTLVVTAVSCLVFWVVTMRVLKSQGHLLSDHEKSLL